MKTAKKRRSSRGPTTSYKKRNEAVARDLEVLEQENVAEEEVPPPPLKDEIKTEQPEFQEQVVEEMESSESIEKKRLEMKISFKRDEISLLKSETMMLKKEKTELKTEITLMRKDNAKLADDVQTLQNSALDMKDKLLHAKLDNAKLADYVQKLQNDESNMKERLKIRGEKVDELEVQLKTQMLKHKTELETLSKQLQSTSTENNALSKENGMLKDAIDKIGILIRHL